MALRATEGNEKPAGGEDAANEWRVEAGFSTERSRKTRNWLIHFPAMRSVWRCSIQTAAPESGREDSKEKVRFAVHIEPPEKILPGAAPGFSFVRTGRQASGLSRRRQRLSREAT
jgi:hypothetical protein